MEASHNFMTFSPNILKKRHLKSNIIMTLASFLYDATVLGLSLLGYFFCKIFSAAKLLWREIVFFEKIPEGCAALPCFFCRTDHIALVFSK